MTTSSQSTGLHCRCSPTARADRVARGQQISPLQIPESVREVVPDMPREVDLRGPITELKHMATTSEDSIRLVPGWFLLLAALWTSKLGSPFQHIDAVYFKATPNTCGLFGVMHGLGLFGGCAGRMRRAGCVVGSG
jgi:hypothetical protein